jgi:Mrp family chromosome partitioning ATPase
LLERLRSEFDLVLIDSPPAIQISDSRVLARSSDGVVLVLRAGATTFSAAAEAAARFLSDSTPVLGTILNDWDPKVGDTETLRAFSRMYRHYYQSTGT